MKCGDKVIIRHSIKYRNMRATIVGIDKGYCPPITVVVDGDNRIPELAMCFFYEDDLEVIGTTE